MVTTAKKESLARGALWMSIGFFFTACFGALLKASAAHSSALFATWITFAVGAIIQICVYIRSGWGFYKTKRFLFHFGRAFFGVIATVLWVVAIGHILFMNATLLLTTAPLFIPILALIFLRQKASWKVWLSLLVGFVGVVLILHPTMEILEKPWSLIGLASGLTLAVAYLLIKLMTQTEPMGRIVSYFFILGAILLSLFLPFFWVDAGWLAWAFGIGGGITFCIQQFFVVKAYDAANAAAVGPFQYIGVVFAGLLDWIFWHQVPTWTDYVGAVIVIIGGIMVILLSGQRK